MCTLGNLTSGLSATSPLSPLLLIIHLWPDSSPAPHFPQQFSADGCNTRSDLKANSLIRKRACRPLFNCKAQRQTRVHPSSPALGKAGSCPSSAPALRCFWPVPGHVLSHFAATVSRGRSYGRVSCLLRDGVWKRTARGQENSKTSKTQGRTSAAHGEMSWDSCAWQNSQINM